MRRQSYTATEWIQNIKMLLSANIKERIDFYFIPVGCSCFFVNTKQK